MQNDTAASGADSFPDFKTWGRRDQWRQPCVDSAILFREIRAGRLAQAFADDAINDGLAAELGVDRAYLEALGGELCAAYHVGGNHRKAGAVLQRIIRRLLKDLRRKQHPKAAEHFLHYLCWAQAELARREFSGVTNWPRIFGVVIGVCEEHSKRGLPVNFEYVCHCTAKLEGASVTDTKNAILAHTRDVNLKLSDWLAPCQRSNPKT